MRLTIVVLGIAISLAPRLAHAVCAGPGPWFSVAGSVVPRDPTLLLFVPTGAEGGQLTATGASVAMSEVSRSPAFVVYKIRATRTARKFELHYQLPVTRGFAPQVISAEYEIGSAPVNAARVTDVTHAYSRWTCSHTDAVRFTIEGTAIAYRLDWRSTQPATIIDASDPLVGDLDCIGTNVDVDLSSLQTFDLVALFADGSERALGSASMSNTGTRIRLPLELLGENADDIEATRKPGAFFVIDKTNLTAFGAHCTLALLAFLLSGLAVGAATARLPNRPRD
jgi:hypothetical protein